MKPTILLNALSVALVLTFATPLWAESSDEVDHVALAARLVRDGHFDRASSVLKSVDPSADEGIALAEYWTVRGLIELNERKFEDAIRSLELAMQNGKVDDLIFVYLAQAYWGLRDWNRTIRSVDNADEAGAAIAGLQLIKARAQHMLGDSAAAWKTLQRGSRRFPDDLEFTRQSAFLLIELGLYQEALVVGNQLVNSGAAGAEDYLALGEGLRRNLQSAEAIGFLERARLVYPTDKRVVVQLAHAYVDHGQLLSAADLFQRASELEAGFVLEAAELYRRAGHFERALYMNGQVDAQNEKFRQRVAILTDMERFEAVAALEPRLERLGLLDDQAVLYALAYARFKVGDFAAAERLLKKVKDPAVFRNATQLRKVMTHCQQNPSSC